jgi:hypothetical protein
VQLMDREKIKINFMAKNQILCISILNKKGETKLLPLLIKY